MQCLYKLVDKAIIYELVSNVKSVLSKGTCENSQPQSGSEKNLSVWTSMTPLLIGFVG